MEIISKYSVMQTEVWLQQFDYLRYTYIPFQGTCLQETNH